jgi:hypothetical protein
MGSIFVFMGWVEMLDAKLNRKTKCSGPSQIFNLCVL